MAPTLGMVVPATPAAPPRISLVSSAEVTETTRPEEMRWGQGIELWPEPCAPPDDSAWWVCEDGTNGGDSAENVVGTKDKVDNEPIRRYRPFTIFVALGCSTSQLQQGEELVARANRAIEAWQSHLIERELLDGTVAQAAGFPNDYLENSPTTFTISEDYDVLDVDMLGVLEAELGLCQPGQVSMIHASRFQVMRWFGRGLLEAEPNGRRLRTKLGTIVVPGTGYATGGAPPDREAYGTGLVRVWLGPIVRLTMEPAAVNRDRYGIDPAEVVRGTNDLVMIVERAVAALWDGCCKIKTEGAPSGAD